MNSVTLPFCIWNFCAQCINMAVWRPLILHKISPWLCGNVMECFPVPIGQNPNIPLVPACVTMLRHLLHHDYTLRHNLSHDPTIYYDLVRGQCQLLRGARQKLFWHFLFVMLWIETVALWYVDEKLFSMPELSDRLLLTLCVVCSERDAGAGWERQLPGVPHPDAAAVWWSGQVWHQVSAVGLASQPVWPWCT